MMITLSNVMDTRTGNFYSVVVISGNKVKFFVPVMKDGDGE